MDSDRDISINLRRYLNDKQINVSPEIMENAFEIFASKLSTDDSKIIIKSSLNAFSETLFGEKNSQHHLEVIEGLELWEDVTTIVPRGSGKTSLQSVRYPAWRIGDDRALRIIVASHTARNSEDILRSIESVFDMESYQEIYGIMRPMTNSDLPWNNSTKTVRDRPQYNKLGFRADAKEPTLFAVGVGGAIVGKRSDILIFDDIIDRRTVKTESQLSDIELWLNEEIYPTRHYKSQTIVSGTRWGARDIYIKIMSDMLSEGAIIHGNMIDEVNEQIKKYRELEDSLVSF